MASSPGMDKTLHVVHVVQPKRRGELAWVVASPPLKTMQLSTSTLNQGSSQVSIPQQASRSKAPSRAATRLPHTTLQCQGPMRQLQLLASHQGSHSQLHMLSLLKLQHRTQSARHSSFPIPHYHATMRDAPVAASERSGAYFNVLRAPFQHFTLPDCNATVLCPWAMVSLSLCFVMP